MCKKSKNTNSIAFNHATPLVPFSTDSFNLKLIICQLNN